MKKTFVIFTFLLVSLPSLCFAEQGKHSFGMGLGPTYNGLGINYRIPTTYFSNYLSIGCPTIGYGTGSGFIGRCGIGYSLLKTITPNRRHGLGTNLGISYAKYAVENGQSNHIGIFYAYYFNNEETTGWNIQFGPAIEYFDQEYFRNIYLGFGYQY